MSNAKSRRHFAMLEVIANLLGRQCKLALLAFSLMLTGCQSSDSGDAAPTASEIAEVAPWASKLPPGLETPYRLPDDVPLIAIWLEDGEMHDGALIDPRLSSVRFAIWNDGRIVCGEDAQKWGYGVVIGTISEESIEQLKVAIRESGVFELNTAQYLVPDGPIIYFTANVDDQRQLLVWDEILSDAWGMNVRPDDDYRALVLAWQTLSAKSLSVAKQMTIADREASADVPKSWSRATEQ